MSTNHQQLAVNRPRSRVANLQRDGQMAIDNGGSAQNYAPVQAAGTHPLGFGHGDEGWALGGMAGRFDERGVSDDFRQPGNLYRVMDADARDRLTTNIAASLKGVSADVRERQIGHFMKADPAYGKSVMQKLAVLDGGDASASK